MSIDFPFFETVYFDEDVKNAALKVVGKYPMKALDTIQLATLICVENQVESFVVCDQKLKKYALKEGFHVKALENAMRAVEVNPGDGTKAIDEMRSAGAEIINRQPSDARIETR